jgi:hypothetical protein
MTSVCCFVLFCFVLFCFSCCRWYCGIVVQWCSGAVVGSFPLRGFGCYLGRIEDSVYIQCEHRIMLRLYIGSRLISSSRTMLEGRVVVMKTMSLHRGHSTRMCRLFRTVELKIG